LFYARSLDDIFFDRENDEKDEKEEKRTPNLPLEIYI